MSVNSAQLLTPGKGNFFFGFHDIVAWNANGDRLATLRIEDMSTPPQPGDTCEVGFVKNGDFVKLGDTRAFNYPQGARQQWIGDSNLLIVNDLVGDDWGSRIFDTDKLEEVNEIPHSTHVIKKDGWAFGLDYARLHRVGGYGYTGLKDKTQRDDAPAGSGIIKHNVFTGESSLLLSIKTVADFEYTGNPGKHHYLTHLVLNPSGTRIAFLHRFKLKDGGETSRLMTIGANGEDLRCLATGFLSHFDWKDDQHVAIWGRTGSGIEKLRNSFFYRMMPSGLIAFAKKWIKKLLYKPAPAKQGESLFNWLIFSDQETSTQQFLAKNVIVEDGHPMFCPANRDWMICDSYPDKDGIRKLFLFQVSTRQKIMLGTFKMIDDKPEIARLGASLDDIEPSVLKAFDTRNMAFYRSGFHCDLHPRWKADGKMVAFDSIHEGRRAVYGFDVSSYTGTP